MQRWEYFTLDRQARIAAGTSHMLAQLGSQGWELVCLADDYLIFKRPVAPPPGGTP